MRLAFWEWMVAGGASTSAAEQPNLAERGSVMRDGKLKSQYGPYRARDLFKVPLNREDGPIWTFDRMGATRTRLPDGRLVCIGGEHEDCYDPDFCIYNDVIVLGSTQPIEIYGYPEEVFPPTDFHTATATADNRIVIVGRLGYKDARRPGHTPVYALDLSDYRISQVETFGEMPGWIFKHAASLGFDGTVVIRGGQIIEEYSGEERYWRNVEDHALDLTSGLWRRLTHRNWRQFSVRQKDRGLFVLDQSPEPSAILPRRVEHRVVKCDGWNCAQIVVAGVSVRLVVGVDKIEIIVEGALNGNMLSLVTEDIRSNVEAAIRRACILDEK